MPPQHNAHVTIGTTKGSSLWIKSLRFMLTYLLPNKSFRSRILEGKCLGNRPQSQC
jgi:hypothetical protein